MVNEVVIFAVKLEIKTIEKSIQISPNSPSANSFRRLVSISHRGHGHHGPPDSMTDSVLKFVAAQRIVIAFVGTPLPSTFGAPFTSSAGARELRAFEGAHGFGH
jgi:hypothetical protein